MRRTWVRPLVLALMQLITSSTLAAEPPPDVKAIKVPVFPGSHAIWGATGSDSRGHVWFAVCADKVALPSAHLYEMTPDTGEITDRGDVVGELRKAGLHRDGEGQMKIHSRIVQAADGHLYFASMDEEGEKEDGSRLPTWGSHWWRYHIDEHRWQHLMSVPEALIAGDAGGRWVYALGYFGHVLYQFDTVSGAFQSVKVGSVDGHISRNIVCDASGHVYVPRLTRAAGAPVTVTLVEFDTALHEVAQTPIPHYLGSDKPTDCHGIVAIEHLTDGSLCFITHAGWLYRIVPNPKGPATVTEVGPINPRGESYTASLFCIDGKRALRAASRAKGSNQYEWLRYDLETKRCEVAPFNLNPPSNPPLEQALLYGSITRDKSGNCYLVGTHWRNRLAVMLQVKD